MADIKLVIKISEDSWKATCNGHMLPTDVENVVQGIKNGTVLSKCKAENCISRSSLLEKQYRIDDSATLSTRDVVNVEDIEDAPPVYPSGAKMESEDNNAEVN